MKTGKAINGGYHRRFIKILATCECGNEFEYFANRVTTTKLCEPCNRIKEKERERKKHLKRKEVNHENKN